MCSCECGAVGGARGIGCLGHGPPCVRRVSACPPPDKLHRGDVGVGAIRFSVRSLLVEQCDSAFVAGAQAFIEQSGVREGSGAPRARVEARQEGRAVMSRSRQERWRRAQERSCARDFSLMGATPLDEARGGRGWGRRRGERGKGGAEGGAEAARRGGDHETMRWRRRGGGRGDSAQPCGRLSAMPRCRSCCRGRRRRRRRRGRHRRCRRRGGTHARDGASPEHTRKCTRPPAYRQQLLGGGGGAAFASEWSCSCCRRALLIRSGIASSAASCVGAFSQHAEPLQQEEPAASECEWSCTSVCEWSCKWHAVAHDAGLVAVT